MKIRRVYNTLLAFEWVEIRSGSDWHIFEKRRKLLVRFDSITTLNGVWILSSHANELRCSFEMMSFIVTRASTSFVYVWMAELFSNFERLYDEFFIGRKAHFNTLPSLSRHSTRENDSVRRFCGLFLAVEAENVRSFFVVKCQHFESILGRLETCWRGKKLKRKLSRRRLVKNLQL